MEMTEHKHTFRRFWAVIWALWGLAVLIYEVRGRMVGFPPGEVFGGPWAWATLLIPAHVVSYGIFRFFHRD